MKVNFIKNVEYKLTKVKSEQIKMMCSWNYDENEKIYLLPVRFYHIVFVSISITVIMLWYATFLYNPILSLSFTYYFIISVFLLTGFYMATFDCPGRFILVKNGWHVRVKLVDYNTSAKIEETHEFVESFMEGIKESILQSGGRNVTFEKFKKYIEPSYKFFLMHYGKWPSWLVDMCIGGMMVATNMLDVFVITHRVIKHVGAVK